MITIVNQMTVKRIIRKISLRKDKENMKILLKVQTHWKLTYILKTTPTQKMTRILTTYLNPSMIKLTRTRIETTHHQITIINNLTAIIELLQAAIIIKIRSLNQETIRNEIKKEMVNINIFKANSLIKNLVEAMEVVVTVATTVGVMVLVAIISTVDIENIEDRTHMCTLTIRRPL